MGLRKAFKLPEAEKKAQEAENFVHCKCFHIELYPSPVESCPVMSYGQGKSADGAGGKLAVRSKLRSQQRH